jgi:tetratricopeptide (TPR) repeat protein
MKKPTVGLYMIVKDEVDEVKELLKEAYPYFNSIYLTVSDKKAYNKLKDSGDTIIVDYRKWTDRFDEARTHNYAQGDTDYAFWLDADDLFDFSKIPQLRQLAVNNDLDAIWLPYEYAYDNDGNCIALHWRERLTKKDQFEWKGWVHETQIPIGNPKTERVYIPVRHQNTNTEGSRERNHEILKKAYEETRDARYIHYLGISYYSLQDWEKCIQILKEYVEVGGWDEEIYRSLLRMSEAANHLGSIDEAKNYALQAMGMLPQYPQAYFNLAQFEFEENNFKETLEWLKVAFSKPEPESVSITDPTIPDRAKLMGAISEFSLGNHEEALKLLETVQTIDTSDLLPHYKHETGLDNLAKILPAVAKHYQIPEQLWTNLKEDIKYDSRFRKLRELVTEPTTWPVNSIVFFCGRGYEDWGPHTLDKGMGGSEEAIVYLTRELAKKGYQVTVFGEVPKEYEDEGVQWKPWKQIDKRDHFDTLVVWRYPQFASQFKANKTLIDMHDKLPTSMVKENGAIYMFKSDYHADQYDVKTYNVVGNGIKFDQFNQEHINKPFSVGYFSAYYRGLECLVDLWPQIKAQVPEATLDIYYGWQSWVSAEGEDSFYHRMTQKLKDGEKLGITEHGRVSHEVLAKKMLETKVWAYPTEFDEIHCITALKANAAGMKPVITDKAALKETGGPEATFIETDRIYTDDYNKKKLVDAIVSSLKEERDQESINNQILFAERSDWVNVAQEWSDIIDA